MAASGVEATSTAGVQGKVQSDEVTAGVADGALSFTARRNGYEKISDHTMAMYGLWDMIIEPNCEMVFEIDNFDPSNDYQWSIDETPEEDIPTYGNTADFQLSAQAGAEIELIREEDEVVVARFKGVNVYYRVSLTMYNTDHPDGLVHKLDGVTKFVRREIRTLTDSDRNKVAPQPIAPPAPPRHPGHLTTNHCSTPPHLPSTPHYPSTSPVLRRDEGGVHCQPGRGPG